MSGPAFDGRRRAGVRSIVRFKNRDIEKPPMDLEELADFSLGIDSIRADFAFIARRDSGGLA